jgi:hypothetical protein
MFEKALAHTFQLIAQQYGAATGNKKSKFKASPNLKML